MRFSPIYLILFLVLSLSSCDENRVFEKDIDLDNYEWGEENSLRFEVPILDTEAKNLYINLRHRFAFNWRNVWLEMKVKTPKDSSFTLPLNLTISQPDGQWYGECSGDVCRVQIPVKTFTNYSFSDTGLYVFTLKQIMRENPLQSTMSVGIRLENLLKEE